MKQETLTREQLNRFDKEMLITLLLGMQEQITQQTMSIEKLTEQISLMNTRTFGKKSENIQMDEDQLNVFTEIFNEAEHLRNGQLSIEPSKGEILVPEHKRCKRQGKRNQDLMDFDSKIIEHTRTEAELAWHFPEGYNRLPDEVYRKLELIPAVLEVHEHHIAVYKGKNGNILKAEHPKEMLNGSIATPSLVAGVINSKYTNAVPLYRQEQEFARNDVNISRQTMANLCVMAIRSTTRLKNVRIRSSVFVAAGPTPEGLSHRSTKLWVKKRQWVL